MVTVEWRWPFKLVIGQDKLYCITYRIILNSDHYILGIIKKGGACLV